MEGDAKYKWNINISVFSPKNPIKKIESPTHDIIVKFENKNNTQANAFF